MITRAQLIGFVGRAEALLEHAEAGDNAKLGTYGWSISANKWLQDVRKAFECEDAEQETDDKT